MNINIQIENTRQELINHINNSQLPIGVVSLIIKDIYREVQALYQDTLKQEQQQQTSQKAEVEAENTETIE